MNRVVLLDTGIIGLITNPKRAPESLACNCWLQTLIKAGIRVILPEIADYEVRRELLRANKIKGIENERASVGVAGVIGVIGTAVVAGVFFKIIARKPEKTKR